MRQQELLDALREHGPMTPTEMARLFEDPRTSHSTARTSAWRRLKYLEKAGLVRKGELVGKSGQRDVYRWEAVDERSGLP